MLRKTLMLLMTLAFSAPPALAQIYVTNRHSGHSCQGASSANRAAVIYTGGGAYNEDKTAQRVVYCPNQWTDHPTISYVAKHDSIHASVYYYDRSSTDGLSCRIELVNSYGATLVGPTVHSCATWAGCPAPTPAFASFGLRSLYLTLGPHQTLEPLSWAIRCSLPRRGWLNRSGIVSYLFSWQGGA